MVRKRTTQPNNIAPNNMQEENETISICAMRGSVFLYFKIK